MLPNNRALLLWLVVVMSAVAQKSPPWEKQRQLRRGPQKAAATAQKQVTTMKLTSDEVVAIQQMRAEKKTVLMEEKMALAAREPTETKALAAQQKRTAGKLTNCYSAGPIDREPVGVAELQTDARDSHNFTSWSGSWTWEAFGRGSPATKNYYQTSRNSRPGLRWLHVPKCGQSFSITMIVYGCPSVDMKQVEKVEKVLHKEKPHGTFVHALHGKFGLGKETTCSRAKIVSPLWGHVGVARDERGIVTLLRDPWQRIISNVFHFLNTKRLSDDLPTVERLVSESRGCYVRMLTAGECGNKKIQIGMDELRAAVPHALATLRERIAFVGLVERWDESVCLFHVWYFGKDRGGSSLCAIPQELLNLHEGTRASEKVASTSSSLSSQLYNATPMATPAKLYNVAGLRDAVSVANPAWSEHVDSTDGVIYAEAVRMFEDRLTANADAVRDCVGSVHRGGGGRRRRRRKKA